MTESELRNTEDDTIREIQYYKACNRDRDTWLTCKLVILLAVAGIFAIPCLGDTVEFMCPHCEQDINLVVEMTQSDRGWVFPDTWTCSQCGYENYEGIAYCAMCGGR